MPRFFVDNICGDTAVITGHDANHIGRSLRMKIGEEITVCSGGFDFECRIEGITEQSVLCRVFNSFPSLSEPTVKLTLYQAIPKSDKLETIIQKSVELGVYRIVPVITNRCVSKPSEKSFAKKLERFEKISLEAAKQSGRGIIPEVSEAIAFKDAVADMQSSDIRLICYEKGGERLSGTNLSSCGSVSVIIGSEGGFDTSEIEFAKNNSVTPIWLGNRILRCETAPLAVISIIMNLTGNM